MLRWLSIPWLSFLLTACGKPIVTDQGAGIPSSPEVEKGIANKEVMGEADQIASLIDPAKLATLRERGANPRIQKITAILLTVKSDGKDPEVIIGQAICTIGWGDTQKGDLTAAAIIRNLTIAERLGATTPEDIEKMHRGNAATVLRGPYTGDVLSVDHIIPRSIAPSLDTAIANLELMPLRVNQAKGNKVGARQRDLAKRLHAAGLLESPALSE